MPTHANLVFQQTAKARKPLPEALQSEREKSAPASAAPQILQAIA